MKKIASFIDHTLLRQNATKGQIIEICDEAIQHGFASVCVNPFWVPTVSKKLSGAEVKTCAVVGFPLGATSSDVKAFETQWCIQNGAREIDMVMNIGMALSGDWDFVRGEIAKLAEITKANKAILKVIFENCLISKDDIVNACRASVVAGADFVKTSTGFSTGGATMEDLRLMLSTVAGACKVKASGGVKNADQAQEMIAMGVARIGTSSGVQIVSGKTAEGAY